MDALKAWPEALIFFMNSWDSPNKKSSTYVDITASNLPLLQQINTEGSNLLTVTHRDNDLYLTLIFHNWEASVSSWMGEFDFYTLFGLSSASFQNFFSDSAKKVILCQ